jgi:hypothetical protein
MKEHFKLLLSDGRTTANGKFGGITREIEVMFYKTSSD